MISIYEADALEIYFFTDFKSMNSLHKFQRDNYVIPLSPSDACAMVFVSPEHSQVCPSS